MSKQFVYSKGFDKFVKSKRLKGDGANKDKKLNKHTTKKEYMDGIPSTIDKNRITLVTTNLIDSWCGGGTVDVYIVPKDKTYNSELWKRVYIARGLSNFGYSWRNRDERQNITKYKRISESSRTYLSSGEYDSLAYHKDKLLDLEDDSVIISVSFGEPRPIVFKSERDSAEQKILLRPG